MCLYEANKTLSIWVMKIEKKNPYSLCYRVLGDAVYVKLQDMRLLSRRSIKKKKNKQIAYTHTHLL